VFGLNLGGSGRGICIEEERQALVEFKQGVKDDFHVLSSWDSQEEEDCCKWKGIKCSNRTSHVVRLDLRQSIFFEAFEFLSGEISPSILGLQHLTYLDLSCNDFSTLPGFIGSLTKLQYLNLSFNAISGTIPWQLGNLSRLTSLDLSWNYYGVIEDPNLDWLFHLSSLRYLDMSHVNLSKAVNWPDKVNMLPSLLYLYLSDCELSMPFSLAPSNVNSSSPLLFLGLSYNHLNSSIFPWIYRYNNSLVHLDLTSNKLLGSIPKGFENMVALSHLLLSSNNLTRVMLQTLENLHSLRVLDLSNNSISGEVPDLSKLSFLTELHLSNNRLNGSLAKSIGKFYKLQILDLSSNSLEGVITESHLSNFFTLHHLDLSFNSLSLKFSPAWVPPFHLDTIRLRSCKLGPIFPEWLRTQENFSQLDMSDVGIIGTIPNWFWGLSSNIMILNLSHNQLTGTVPLQWFSTRFIGYPQIDLSYNRLSGTLPRFNSDPIVLNLSNNLFQGSITSICETNGSVNASYKHLSFLDLSDNLFSGELPNCWGNMMYLTLFNLANNNFSGRIPDSICSSKGYDLQTLHLQNNNFIGGLPKSLVTCSSLKLLDLGENRLSGRIPTWIGTNLPNLIVLRLPSNLFMGCIPLQLCHLTSLQILDLSHNNIIGTIPKCLNNFTLMAQTQSSYVSILNTYVSSSSGTSFLFSSTNIDNLLVTFKEKYVKYHKTLGLVKVIDLSSNKLKGEIPQEITSLSGLISLNLSRNLLTGIIPQNIGDMERLESLDLSKNHLSGIISPSLTTLSFLSYLNLSDNNLSGKIPSGTQLQSFSASAYASNQELCGLPLPKRCLGDEATQDPQIGSKYGDENIQEHANSHEHLWFYATIALGFIVGFWGVCGPLLLKSSWRHAYFQYLERIRDRLYKIKDISKAKLLKTSKTHHYQENI
jgi:EIX receptor 1/2